jgi:hypothetical protein
MTAQSCCPFIISTCTIVRRPGASSHVRLREGFVQVVQRCRNRYNRAQHLRLPWLTGEQVTPKKVERSAIKKYGTHLPETVRPAVVPDTSGASLRLPSPPSTSTSSKLPRSTTFTSLEWWNGAPDVNPAGRGRSRCPLVTRTFDDSDVNLSYGDAGTVMAISHCYTVELGAPY